MRRVFLITLFGLLMAGASCAPTDKPAPAAANHPSTTDPTGFDPDYPPAMSELSFNSGGSKLNGLMYIAAGVGPHPTVVFVHGYAGNERNLDLAQAVRRAGANALFFDYRGSWGSGGEFSAGNGIEDVAAAVAFVRSEEATALYRADPQRVMVVGHSLGGFMAAIAAAEDPSLSCLGFLAGANLGPWGRLGLANEDFRVGITAALGASMDYESGPIKADPEMVVEEIIERADDFDIAARASALSSRAIFMAIGERDESLPKAAHHDPVLAALLAAGAERVTEVVFDDDHSFSAHRIELSRRLIDWARTECWQ